MRERFCVQPIHEDPIAVNVPFHSCRLPKKFLIYWMFYMKAKHHCHKSENR